MSLHVRLQPAPPYDPLCLLRPTERAITQIACRVQADRARFARADALIVADQSGSGEAGVLIILPPHEGSDVRLLHVLPISPSFKLSLNQTPPSPSNSFFHQSSRPHITLTLNSSPGSGSVSLRISASETVKTQAFVFELRKRVELSPTVTRPDGALPYAWAASYPAVPPADDFDEEMTVQAESSSSVVSPSTSSIALSTPLTGFTLSPEPVDEDEFPNPYLPTFSRTAFFRRQVFAKQDQWSSRECLKLRLSTYNVNDKLPPTETTELASVVGQGEEDILVFGFQEVDLRSAALLVSQGTTRAYEWEAALLRGLGDKAGEYERLAVTQYVGVMTIVLVKKTLREAISHVQTSERGIGLLGFGGNKAGVAVRFKVHDSTLCFVNSHLAAFAAALDRRRADYQTLLKGLSFNQPVGEDVVPALEEFMPEHPDRLLSIEDCHALFWLGDLNYRIAMEDDILRAWMVEGRWQAILEKDQLRADIASGKSFADFNEHNIDFPPTFKYVHGSTTLDLRRAPAYTDRILWATPLPPAQRNKPPPSATSPALAFSRTASSTSIPLSRSNSTPIFPRSTAQSTLTCPTQPIWRVTPHEYMSHEVLWSDHRPVSATMETEVRVVDMEKRAEFLAGAMREVEKLEEVYRPALEVDTSVEFGEVCLRKTVVKEVVLRNTGRVPASFSFRSPGSGKMICKDIFWVLPCNGTVPPGQEWRLRVAAFVHESWAAKLTLGEEEMSDVLVLQVTDGKDIFITLSGTFAPTILGLPLAVLPTLPSHIRSLSMSRRKALAGKTPHDQVSVLKSDIAVSTENHIAPDDEAVENKTTEKTNDVDKHSNRPAKEIWMLLEYLMVHGGGGADLWVSDVSNEEILEVIECLDTSQPLPTGSALTVSRAVLYLLGNFPEPLLPGWLQTVCLAADGRDEAFAALEGMPTTNTNVLIGLMSVARLCLQRLPSPFQAVPKVQAEEISEADSITTAAKADGETESPPSRAEPSADMLDVLAKAVFGVLEPADVEVVKPKRKDMSGVETTKEGRRRFVRLLLEG